MKNSKTIVVSTIIICILISTGYYFLKINNIKTPEIAPITTKEIPKAVDTDCTGEKNEGYEEGFGVENKYTGFIKKDLPINITLSCNHEKLTISGSVNQTIYGKDIPENDTGWVADLSSGAEVINVNTDYNFDGYNDISSMYNNGSQIENSYIFLFDPINNQFKYNKDLSVMANIMVDAKNKKIIEAVCPENINNINCEKHYPTYIWNNGILNKAK